MVIVLSFIVLIAIVLLSFLASTQSSLKKSASSEAMVLTEFLAESATTAIVDDLRQEMLAGSDGSSEPATGEFMKVTQPWAMVPARVLTDGISGTNTIFLNLAKQSVRAKAFYPGSNAATYSAKGVAAGATGRTRGSAVNTAQPALNGRLLSPARWNKPLLLSGAGFTSTNQLPDWILISRQGPLTNGAAPGSFTNKISSNQDYVIGRFAYNIYDIGGLLDINVAGFNPNDASALANAARKGSMAWADLRAIPGILDPSQIVQWRNKLSATNGTAYLNMVQTWGDPNGFTKSFRQGGDVENRFFTRQDLLKYTQTYGTNALTTNALPFLTTFSADTDRPSFVPDSARPKVQRASSAGGNDAYGNDDAINPSLLTVKNADGNLAVKRRFPLERLKYVQSNPSGADAVKIAEFFGLTWDNSDKCWDYQDGNQIKRLTEISGREPNLIELLQAAISVGSLGGQFQISEEPAFSPRIAGFRDGSVSNQIIQIAANIIDQYDTDSYPTRIRLGGRIFSGIEDLPYLFAIRFTAYRQAVVQASELVGVSPPSAPAGMPYRCALILQPTVWNPHAPSATVFNGPTHFRIVAEGDIYPEARIGWWPGAGSLYYTGQPSSGTQRAYPSSNPKDAFPRAVFDPGVDFITFETNGSGAAAFREAYTLTSSNYPSGSQASGPTEPISDPLFNQAAGENTSTALGFLAGYMWGGAASGDLYFENGRAVTSEGIDFSLQYENPAGSGNWLTYDVMESVPGHDNIYQNNPTARRPRAWTRVDPRADRFGYRNYLFDSTSGWPQGTTYRPGTAIGLTGFGDTAGLDPSPFNWTAARPGAWGLISQNKTGDTVRYRDADGVQRIAMGGASAGNSVDGLPMATGNTVSRPVMLNRPFRSVAELGYASRGTPWKQLDCWTPGSGDAALLDLFCLTEPTDAENLVVSGRVNLNSRRSEVLGAVLRGVEKSEGGVRLSDADAQSVADALVAWTGSGNADRGPLRNRAELLGRFASGTSFTGFSSELQSAFSNAQDRAIPARRQSVMRALADVGSTRTWTFLIDLIVQKGRYLPNASSLDQFAIDGEQRFWVHLAIDRYTGEVISQMVEAVNE